MKTRSHCGTFIECSIWNPQVPNSCPIRGKKKISHRSNQTILPPIPLHQSYIPEITKVKTTNHCGTFIECRIWDSEIPSSSPIRGKKKISHRSNQTIPPPIPLHQNKISEIVRGGNQMSLWHSAWVQDLRSIDPQFKFQCVQKENLSKVKSEQY